MFIRPMRHLHREGALFVAFVSLLISLSAPDSLEAQAPFRVAASAGVAGEFARPVCEQGDSLLALPFAATARDLPRRRSQGDIIIDTGGLFARHGVVRFASREHLPSARPTLVTRGTHWSHARARSAKRGSR